MVEKTRKIIFLDVDGVLNTTKSGITRYPVNRPRLRLLKQIVDMTGAEIVLSSTWRRFPDHLQALEKRLSYRGLKIASVTPYLQNCPRGLEIQTWLDANPDVLRYVILDDSADMLPIQFTSFIWCDQDHGLTPILAYRAACMLNKGLSCLNYKDMNVLETENINV